MKTFVSRFVTACLSLCAFSFLLAGCDHSTSPFDTSPIVTTGSGGNLTGKVTSSNGYGIPGVAVRVGTALAYTNSKGDFFLPNVPAGNRVLVNFSIDSHAPTQKILAVKSGRTSWVEATLFSVGASRSIDAGSGGTVQFTGASVAFPANAFVDAQGNPYNGSALVKATWGNPTANGFFGFFPGEFSGTRTDQSETMIESFGFINVEITGGGGKLQLTQSKPATLTFPIPATLRGKAPQSIPLWYYDEAKGKWIEEGQATRSGDTYVGTVKHFSSWNCDMPAITSYLEGRVVDKNGNPLSFANVHSTGVDYTGASMKQTDDQGRFKLPVKSDATARVWAKYYTVSSVTQDVATPPTGQVKDIGTITIDVDTADFCPIVGRVVDNGGLPVAYMYLTLRDASGKSVDQVGTSKEGRFKFFGEVGSTYTVEVRVYHGTDSTVVTRTVTCQVAGQTIDLGDITIDIGGSTVVGRVLNASGGPVAQAYVFSTEGSSNTQDPGARGSVTDSTGRFSLWVRPNRTFDIRISYMQQTKTITVTSGALGETKDIGDIQFP